MQRETRLDRVQRQSGRLAGPCTSSPPSPTSIGGIYLLYICPDTGHRAANSALSEPAAVRTGGSLTGSMVPNVATLYGALSSATIIRISILVLLGTTAEQCSRYIASK